MGSGANMNFWNDLWFFSRYLSLIVGIGPISLLKFVRLGMGALSFILSLS